ncbi:hypothetical protein Ddye_012077 [Dipteronia dyeriana]|uniref:CCHC-type domain-containing protein n=1 Tax=Dipteronia dyeriana TaxID=168575 RepID=A0AAD9X3S3_9ROSI|nr:hypothetical protein Ddye_012077 [Dipteronia dyeriana]
MDFISLCTNFYKRQTLINSYSVPIIPVGHPFTWVMPSDITERVVLNPISRRQAGPPRAGRHISSSARITTQNCRRCGQPGHNFRRCSNPALINEGPSRVVIEEASVSSVIQLATTDIRALPETPPWNDFRRYDDNIMKFCTCMTCSITEFQF